jgi:hypothetical protein
MKSTFLWALIVLNVLLLIGVVGRFSRPNAAVAQAVRRPGEYIMIPGEVSGGNAGVVYILDTTNGLLSAMTLQPGNERMVSMPKIDLAQIFARGADAVEKGGANKPAGRK